MLDGTVDDYNNEPVMGGRAFLLFISPPSLPSPPDTPLNALKKLPSGGNKVVCSNAENRRVLWRGSSLHPNLCRAVACLRHVRNAFLSSRCREVKYPFYSSRKAVVAQMVHCCMSS